MSRRNRSLLDKLQSRNARQSSSADLPERSRLTAKEIAPGVIRIDIGEPAGPLRDA
jgi:hypothetical protein